MRLLKAKASAAWPIVLPIVAMRGLGSLLASQDLESDLSDSSAATALPLTAPTQLWKLRHRLPRKAPEKTQQN